MGIKKVSGTVMSSDNSSVFYIVMAIGLLLVIVGFGMLWKPISVQPEPSSFGLLFFLLGAAIVVLWGMLDSIVLDKSSGKLKYSYWSVLSRGSREVELAKIAAVSFTKVWQSRLGRWGGRTVFKQKDDTELVVLEAINSPDDAKKIADFLGVPFTHIQQPSSPSDGHLDASPP